MDEIREIKENELDIWNRFVEDSKQGNFFSTSLWMYVLNKYPDGNAKLLGVFNSNELVSGVLLYERKKALLNIMAYPPLTPFTSILFKHIMPQKKIIESFCNYLNKRYNFIALQLDPSIKDIRPFLWKGWKPVVNYTYEIDISDTILLWEKIDKDAKYEINKAKKNNVKIIEGDNIEKFLNLYEKTFLKQGLRTPLNKDFIKEMFEILSKDNKARLYYAKTSEGHIISGSIVVWDSKRAYYLLSASEPGENIGANYFLLWHIITDMSKLLDKIDLVGANIPSVARFKRKIATRLVPYYTVEKYSPFYVEYLHKVYQKPKKVEEDKR